MWLLTLTGDPDKETGDLWGHIDPVTMVTRLQEEGGSAPL